MTAADPGVEETQLANGLRIVSEAMPEARSVTIGAWVRVGGRDEPDHLSGVSHFLEHLLFKGSETRSARDIAETIDAVGGELNAFTSREHTAYYARLPHQHLALGLEVLGDVLTAPAFRSDDIEAERQVILEEIAMNLDSPEDRVHLLLSAALFPDHPLGRDVIGERASVTAVRKSDITGFFGRWYRPASTILVAAGQLHHDALVRGVEAALAAGTAGELPRRAAPVAPPLPAAVEDDDTEQSHLCLGWRGFDHHDDDRWALAVANQVLGGGAASRLFQEVREERGLAYSVYSYPTGYQDSGALTVYLGTAPSRAHEALKVVEGVLHALVADGPTEREVEVAAGYLEGSLVLGLEDSGGRMGRLGRDLVQHDSVTPLDEHVARLRAVTTSDVQRVLERIVTNERTLAAVGPGARSLAA